MKDYKQIASAAVSQAYGLSFDCDIDPNMFLDSEFADYNVPWYPTYLFRYDRTILMFRPFGLETFPDIEVFLSECVEIKRAVEFVASKGYSAKVFFIVGAIVDAEYLRTINLGAEFGLIYHGESGTSIELTIQSAATGGQRLLAGVLQSLAASARLTSPVGAVVKRFAQEAIRVPSPQESEDQRIRKFINDLLSAHPKLKLEPNIISFMRDAERTLQSAGHHARDHYYHAVNTLLLGFYAFEKIPGKFDSLMRNYGSDILIDLVWAITALYHDTGYPGAKTDDFVRDANIEGVCPDYSPGKEFRIRSLKDMKVARAIDVLAALFDYASHGETGGWRVDGYQRECANPEFANALAEAYVEGYHGALSALKLAATVDSRIKTFRADVDREFIYRHILIASLSILFHDAKVRACFRKHGICNIAVKNFSLASLLTYMDVIQDDRRDISGSVSRPDIFRDIVVDNGTGLRAVLSRESLNDDLVRRLLSEMSEAFIFFVSNGVSFKIPAELGAGS